MSHSLPPKLYKYQPYTIQALDNLKNRILWFSKPSKFNDPFDCAIKFQISDMGDIEWQDLFENYREKLLTGENISVYSEKGIPNQKFKNDAIKGANKALKERIEIMRHQKGVACFSEKKNDILMWSHYANGHKGFCLEFDTSFPAFQKAFPVIYQDELPSLNLVDAVTASTKDYLATIKTKSSHWAYEKEWRLFHVEGDKEYGIEAEALTGVYFGLAMPFVHKEIISLVLAGSPTQLYEMHRSENQFSIYAKPVSYIAYSYHK